MGAEARMLNRVRPSWCASCGATPGPDCFDVGKTKRQVRRAERREVDWATEAALWGDETRAFVASAFDATAETWPAS